MLPNGKYGVGFSQICEQFDIPQKNAARDFKCLLDGTLTILKVKIENSRINMFALPISDYEKLVAKLDRKGNTQAQEFRDNLVGLSLQQLFCDAFNIKFEKAERQQWLKQRQSGKQVRENLADTIEAYINNDPTLSDNYKKFIYSNVSDCLNRAIFDRKASKLKADWNVDNIRDSLTAEELRWVEQTEELAARIIIKDKLEPLCAMKEAINRLYLPKVSR
jgi:hypothetical protein